MEKEGIADNGGLGWFLAFLSELLSTPLLSSPNTIMVILFEANESGWLNVFSPIAGSHQKSCSG